MTGDTAERAGHRELTIDQLWEGVSAELRGKQRSKPHFEEVCRRAFILWNEQAFALVYSLLHQPGGRSLISRMLCRKDPLLSRDPMRLDLLAQEVLVGLCRTFKKKRFQYKGLPQLYGYLDGICTRVVYARSGLREKRQKVIKSIKIETKIFSFFSNHPVNLLIVKVRTDVVVPTTPSRQKIRMTGRD